MTGGCRCPAGVYSASVVDSPLAMGGLLLAGFLILMLLIAIAYFVIKSVLLLLFHIYDHNNIRRNNARVF